MPPQLPVDFFRRLYPSIVERSFVFLMYFFIQIIILWFCWQYICHTKGHDSSYFGAFLGQSEKVKRDDINVHEGKHFKHMVVYVTCPNIEVATKLSHELVRQKLAACVNILPQVKSIYSWKEKIEEDSEVLMMIKTKAVIVSSLIDFVKDHHPYDVPEVIAVDIVKGNEKYLTWIDESIR